MTQFCESSAVPASELKVPEATDGGQEPARKETSLVADVARCFYLRADFEFPWWLDLKREHLELRPGDLVLTGSQVPRGDASHAAHAVALILPFQWIGAWLQRPEQLAGRRIAGDVGWGKVLSAFMAQIAPRLNADAPLSRSLIPQQIGSLLSLVEIELLGELPERRTMERRSEDLVCDLIRQRANEPGLTANEVARSVGISERTLHRTLKAAGRTFGAVLLNERVVIAKRMLEAGNFARLTTAEIGFRAGFADPSYFVRALTRQLGQTPARYRSSWNESREGCPSSIHEDRVSSVPIRFTTKTCPLTGSRVGRRATPILTVAAPGAPPN